jgi:hypothetical protein
MVKLVVISISIKRRTGETTDGHSGGDKHFNKKKTGTRETTDSQIITSSLTISSFSCSSLFIEGLITTSLTICSFCCSNLFIEGLITSNLTKKTGTRETTDGHTGGDEAFNEKTGTAETTDGQT